MTVKEALVHGAALLKSAGIATPTLDASILLADILHTDKTGLILAGTNAINEAEYRRFEQSLELRRAGNCTAYILGRKEFRGLDFIVTTDVLVPRPDTETLVEAALTRIDELAGERALPSPITILDLCTGSGALAVSLKHERPALRMWASDISGKALAVARKNAGCLSNVTRSPTDVHLLEEVPVRFIESDLFDRIREAAIPDLPRFDIIVSNPPYIPTAVIATLSPEVKREPRIALDGGEDGLDLIRRIVIEAPGCLNAGGTLLMEADPAQIKNIAFLLESRGYRDIQTHKDLSGQLRVIGGKYQGKNDPEG